MKRKEIPLSGAGLLNPRALAETLYEKRLLVPRVDYSVQVADDFDALSLSFRNLGIDRPHFPITTLALLALLVRRIAETGRPVELFLPSSYRGQRSSLQRLLGRLGFFDLFLDSAQPWTGKVALHGRTPTVRQDEDPAHMHYLPFRWFDWSWFNYDGHGNPYLHTPTVRGSFERTLADALVAQGFVDQEAIDLFVHVLFLEIAWNTVLHSSSTPGRGYGVVGAQVFASSSDGRPDSRAQDLRTLHLCVADLGLGIPYTLKGYYEKSPRTYETELECSTPSAIVRCAIDPESTSRPPDGFPDKGYQEGYRGLARVADAIRLSGRLVAGLVSMQSAGGGLRLEGQELVVKPKADDSLQKTQLPGVLTTAELRVTREQTRRVSISGSETHARPEIRLVASLADPDTLGLLETPDLLSDLHQAFAIFDLGYADIVRRGLDRFVKASRSRFPDSCLVFWNVRSASSQTQHLADWLVANARSDHAATLLVGGPREALYLRPSGADDLLHSLLKLEWLDRHPPSSAIQRVSIPIDVFAQVNLLVNSQYLTTGFEHAGPDQGFFTGRIHLLSGRDVGRFFSLGRNATQKAQLLRWTSTCAAAVAQIVAGQGVADDDVLVLGLANSVRDILVHAWQEFGFPYAAYTLMTYDVPTTEELDAVIRHRRQVILVTDVVSNASMLFETARLVTRLGKVLLGTVALVDARERPDDGLLDNSSFVQGARLPPARNPEHAGQEYWVDPVSSVPSPTKLFGGHQDKRIEETLALLSETTAVRCGHIVDGQRHMSSYVDVRALIEEKAEWLEVRVRAECSLRLTSRGWTDFSPTLILHPSGIARVEAVHDPAGAAGTLTVYQTGVRQYIPLLRRIWPTSEPVEVPRAFDPGGHPRCARSLEPPGLGARSHRDIVIADDCLWTGRASSQLAQIAISLGGERILVIPLLARMHPQELQQFERLRALDTNDTAGIAEICYVCPLVLPIPHYGASDCPYETTIQKFSRWTGRSAALEREEALAKAELAGQPPTRLAACAQAYTAAWIRFRSYAELASDDEDALERLTHDLETAPAATLLPLLTLFLEDWGLLGRARLRQTVRPILRKIATRVLSSDAASVTEMIAACSLLRSLYPEDFVQSLAAIGKRMLLRPDIALLGRVVLQVSSLPSVLRTAHETVAFLEQVTSATDSTNTKSLAAEDAGRLLGLLTVCRQLLAATLPTPTSEELQPPEAARETLHLLEKSEVITHQARSLIEIVTERGDDVKEYTSETLLRFYARWEEYYKELFQSRLLPLLSALEATLLLTLSRASHLATPTVDYFTGLGSPYGPLNEDLIAFGYALRQLAENPASLVARKALTSTSKRLRDNVLAKDSRLLQTLHAMRGPTIENFVEAIESEIRVATVTKPPISVRVEGLEVLDRQRAVFCPTEIARSGYLAIVENIRSHAFDPKPLKPPEVLVLVHASQLDPETAVTFSVLNNGKPLETPGPESHASRRAAADIRHFGGTLSPPVVSTLHDWEVEQAIELRLW